MMNGVVRVSGITPPLLYLNACRSRPRKTPTCDSQDSPQMINAHANGYTCAFKQDNDSRGGRTFGYLLIDI